MSYLLLIYRHRSFIEFVKKNLLARSKWRWSHHNFNKTLFTDLFDSMNREASDVVLLSSIFNEVQRKGRI